MLDFILIVFCGSIWALLGIISAIASPAMQIREQNQHHKRQNFLNKKDCLFNVRSPYIQCAVNPTEVCDRCADFVEYQEY